MRMLLATWQRLKRVSAVKMLRHNLMFLSVVLLMVTAGETVHNLTFMLITSFGEFGASVNSSGAIPGVDTALNGIRERQDMIPGYNLVYDEVRDSKVSPSCCGSQCC